MQFGLGISSDNNPRQSFFVLFSTTYSLSRLAIQNSSATVKSRRGLRTGSRPDGKLLASNHRQFRCYCPPASQKGVSAAGIDSVAEFRGLFDRISFDGPRFETLVPSPRKRGPGRDDSLFLTSPLGPKCVFSRHDLLNWILLWQQRPSPGIIITTDIHSVGE